MNMTHPLPTSKTLARAAREQYGRGGKPALEADVETLPSNKVVYDTAKTGGDGWNDLELVLPDAHTHAGTGAPLVDYHREHAASKAFDLLRTRLVQALRQHGWTRIAIVAPTSGCGATFTAVNLALSLARVPGSRSVLVDLDQRHPGVANALGLTGDWIISDFLSGRCLPEEHMIRCSDTLALALNSHVNQNASEQLHDDVTAAVLEDTEEELAADVVLYDMPAMLEYDDLAAFLPHVDGVLLIADGTRTTKAQIEECERILDGQTPLLGVVLNRGREAA
ncbi:CpsD/CapB family tyrosine-protein kinase [Roseovarius sp. 2305UL8-3]|uniref:CpsD/CapB family tyrosine-protein kinase n=1 Tax=Roseovarius conchicola TaxID=3121636 RepID=UPI003529327F